MNPGKERVQPVTAPPRIGTFRQERSIHNVGKHRIIHSFCSGKSEYLRHALSPTLKYAPTKEVHTIIEPLFDNKTAFDDI